MRTLCFAAAAVFALSAQASDAPHWSYKEAAHWGDLAGDFATCKLGKDQSPINIVPAKATRAKLDPIAFDYKAAGAEVINNGHTIQVNLPAGSSIMIGKDKYDLLQFHFHTPSEEQINGKRMAMVAHLVHKSAEGKLAVVGVLFKQGKENASLAPVFAHMPDKEGGKAALDKFAPADILPAKQGYYAFTGSLTTPPCSEGVRWQVLKEPVELSAGQIAAFKKIYAMNARPVQPLNGRTVQASD